VGQGQIYSCVVLVQREGDPRDEWPEPSDGDGWWGLGEEGWCGSLTWQGGVFLWECEEGFASRLGGSMTVGPGSFWMHFERGPCSESFDVFEEEVVWP
jgi:hypothetical protein